MKSYPGIPLMITTNKDIEKGRKNETLCREISVKLKTTFDLKLKHWDGRKSIIDINLKIDYMLYEHGKGKDSNISPKKCKLHHEKSHVSMN